MAFSTDSHQTSALLDDIVSGSPAALERLLDLHRDYLKRVVQIRLEPAMSTRVDASDVVQEAQIVIARRIKEFLHKRPTSFRIWIRGKVLDQLTNLQRRHIGAKKRSVLIERRLTDVSSIAIARKLLTDSPSTILRQVELQEQVCAIIEQLGKNDRDVLVMRHAEGLSNAEVADLLGIEPNTARQRYGRALRKLHQLFVEHGMGIDGTEE